MRGAEIIDRADQIHAMLQRQRAPRQRPPRRVNDASRSRNVAFSRSIYAVLITPSPCEPDAGASPRAPACHPRYGARRRPRAAGHSASRPARCRRCARDATAGALAQPSAQDHEMSRESPERRSTSHRYRTRGAVEGAATHPLDQPPDQRHVALFADLTGQPQPGPDHHGQRHPDDAPCVFTRISSACTCPRSRGCSTRCSCTAWPWWPHAPTTPRPSARQTQKRRRWLAGDSRGPAA